MNRTVTAVAPANIALIKYWGMLDEAGPLPANASVSMTLRNCVARCTVRLLPEDAPDEVWWHNRQGLLHRASPALADGILAHLQRLRNAARGRSAPARVPRFRVTTGNTFPTGAGIASSAAGYTALTLAVTTLLGKRPTPADLSVLACSSGSGSAARSAYGGYVRWPADPHDPAGPAAAIAPADHWLLSNVIAVVDSRPKAVTSREGHRRAPTSPFFDRRLQLLPQRTSIVEGALRERDFAALTRVVEEEAVEMHLIAMSSRPPIFYWRPATIEVLAAVRELRHDGIPACATIDAGPNVHVLTTPDHRDCVRAALDALPEVQETIVDEVGTGPFLSDMHIGDLGTSSA